MVQDSVGRTAVKEQHFSLEDGLTPSFGFVQSFILLTDHYILGRAVFIFTVLLNVGVLLVFRCLHFSPGRGEAAVKSVTTWWKLLIEWGRRRVCVSGQFEVKHWRAFMTLYKRAALFPFHNILHHASSFKVCIVHKSEVRGFDQQFDLWTAYCNPFTFPDGFLIVFKNWLKMHNLLFLIWLKVFIMLKSVVTSVGVELSTRVTAWLLTWTLLTHKICLLLKTHLCLSTVWNIHKVKR